MKLIRGLQSWPPPEPWSVVFQTQPLHFELADGSPRSSKLNTVPKVFWQHSNKSGLKNVSDSNMLTTFCYGNLSFTGTHWMATRSNIETNANKSWSSPSLIFHTSHQVYLHWHVCPIRLLHANLLTFHTIWIYMITITNLTLFFPSCDKLIYIKKKHTYDSLWYSFDLRWICMGKEATHL